MSRIFNRDFLATMSDADLQFKINHYHNAIEADRRRGRDTFDLEVEYCYLWSEDEQRQKRREAHAQYVLQNPHLFTDDDFNSEYETYEFDLQDSMNY
jgi:hypothetical protein